MFVPPAATELARPPVVMVATDVDEELQRTRVVKSALLPSL
jgi:hypothetical protein